MGLREAYEPGTPAWSDLFTTDIAAARRFYGGLFGWDAQEMPTDDQGPYTMFYLDGRPAAGGGELGPEQAGMPPAWTMYTSGVDAAATAAAAVRLGGTVMMPVMEVTGQGRMAMIADPTGAVFGIWEPRQHIGAGIAAPLLPRIRNIPRYKRVADALPPTATADMPGPPPTATAGDRSAARSASAQASRPARSGSAEKYMKYVLAPRS